MCYLFVRSFILPLALCWENDLKKPFLRQMLQSSISPQILQCKSLHQNEKNGQALSKRKGNPGASPFFYVPKKARSSKKGPVFASDAFQRYSEDLWEKDFERYVMVKSSSIMQRVSSPGLNVSVQ